MKKHHKYFVAGVLTILLPIVFIILLLYGFIFTLKNTTFKNDDIHVLFTENSPDKKLIVTIFTYSGGGAAGWSGKKVNVRKTDEDLDDREYVFSVSGGTDIQTVWENDSTLQINYLADDRILSLFQKEWNKDKTVRILYNQR